MDRAAPDLDCLCYPAPGASTPTATASANIITDRDGRYIVSGVPAPCGPLLATGPQLLETPGLIAASTEQGTPAHELAVGALESFREREGMILADWRPYQPEPRLRIVRVVT